MKMKTRYKISIVISIIFVSWIGVSASNTCIFSDGPTPDWLGSHNGCGPLITYEIQNYFGILWQNTITDDGPLIINVTRAPGTVILDDAIERTIESCSGKFGIPLERETLWINDTHMIDSKTCELEKRSNSGIGIDRTVYTTPFGSSWRDTTGNYDHCFSYKTDPEYGVQIQNSTHILNPENCEWVLDMGISTNKRLEEYSVKELLENPSLIPILDSHENRISLMSEGDKLVYSCASVSLERITDDQLHYYVKENQTSPHFFPVTEDDLNTHLEVKLLIAASNLLEFPYNDRVHVNFDGVDFVEYEFYIIDKIIEKYGGTRGDYITLDSDYEKRLTNSKKDGFTNYFEAPRIIYNDKIFMLDGTYFWTSDENNLRMGLQLTDSVHEKRKSIELTDEDMIYLPKIKEALNGMQKVQENVHANIGVPENPDWNDYRDWYSNKMTDGMKYGNDFSGFTFDGQFYELSFSIC